MEWQRRLFELNCLGSHDDAATLAREAAWIATAIQVQAQAAPLVMSRSEFGQRPADAFAQDSKPTAEGGFVAEEADRSQFESIIAQYAVDGLTEAQMMFYIIPKLPPKPQMPVMRVLIDEFGCGNLDASHSELYRRLLARKEGAPWKTT